MNRFAANALKSTRVALVATLGIFPVAQGQAQSPPTVGVYFDAAGTQTSKTITTYGVDVDFYVVAKGLPGDIKSYELGLAYQEPHTSLWLDSYMLNPSWGESVCLPDYLDLCIGADPCMVVFGGQAVLAQFTLRVHSPVEDYTICLGPTGAGHGPWFVACESDTAEMFHAPYQGCAVLNPVAIEPPVGTNTRSWSRIKALYTPH